MIHPFGSPCPKCGQDAPVKRWEPKVTEEAYQKQLGRFDKCRDIWQSIPKPPQEEHLVRECRCGCLFWTRTKDYKTKE